MLEHTTRPHTTLRKNYRSIIYPITDQDKNSKPLSIVFISWPSDKYSKDSKKPSRRCGLCNECGETAVSLSVKRRQRTSRIRPASFVHTILRKHDRQVIRSRDFSVEVRSFVFDMLFTICYSTDYYILLYFRTITITSDSVAPPS